MLQFSQFVWTPCYSVWDVFNNFLLIDATYRSKISSDQKRFFIALSLYPFSFFANTPFKQSQYGYDRVILLLLLTRCSVKTGPMLLFTECIHGQCPTLSRKKAYCLAVCLEQHISGTLQIYTGRLLLYIWIKRAILFQFSKRKYNFLIELVHQIDFKWRNF